MDWLEIGMNTFGADLGNGKVLVRYDNVTEVIPAQTGIGYRAEPYTLVNSTMIEVKDMKITTQKFENGMRSHTLESL